MNSPIPNVIFFDKDRKAVCDVLGCALTDIKTAQRQVIKIIDTLQPISNKYSNDSREYAPIEAKEKEIETNRIRSQK